MFPNLKNLSSILLLGLILSVENSYACPNDCSDHGTCSPSDYCVCDDGYSGIDCSYEVVSVTLTQPNYVEVKKNEWKYFRFNLPTTSNVQFEVNITQGDLVAYIDRSMPNEMSYLFSTNVNTGPHDLTLRGLGFGDWFISIKGASSHTTQVHFSITANACDCNNHGTCLYLKPCDCVGDYVGDDCEFPVKLISDGNTTLDVTEGITYFKFLVQASSTAFQLKIESVWANKPEGDDSSILGVAIQEGNTPEYPFQDGLFKEEEQNEISFFVDKLPEADVFYYAAVFVEHNHTSDGGSESDGGEILSLKVSLAQGSHYCSVTSCSLHGLCDQSGKCDCFEDYSGQLCEVREDLDVGKTVEGLVTTEVWNYYNLHVESLNTIKVSLTPKDTKDGCGLRLLAQQDQLPDRLNFDYEAQPGEGSDEGALVLYIPTPIGSVWSLGVTRDGRSANKQCRYELHTDIELCSSDICGEHGVCSRAGECICEDGWGGEHCSLQCTPLSSEEVVTGAVRAFQWVYYCFTSEQSRRVSVLLEEADTKGSMGVFLKKGHEDYPSLLSYDVRDMSPFQNFHSVYLDFKQLKTRTWTVGVFGSPFLLFRGERSFSLSAYSPSFR